MKKNFLLILFFSAILTACTININDDDDDNNDDKTIRGRGDLISHNIALSAFSGVSIIGQADINIEYGEKQSVVVRAQGNIYEVLDVHVSGDVLVIGIEHGCSISTDKGIYVDVITPEAISYASITGSGNVNISGRRQSSFNVDITGAGNIQAYDLPVSTSKISISGAGNCEVNVSENLDVTISGNGSIRYKGQPEVRQVIAGYGSVRSAN
jgi:hypothetical protein